MGSVDIFSKIKANQFLLFKLLKVLIAIISFGYIYITFRDSGGLIKEIIIFLPHIFNSVYSWAMLLVVILVPVNWGIEALKWRFLALKVEKISYATAFKGVLAGVTLGFITPHAIGDYAARVYFFKVKVHIEAIGAILIARISQFYITLFYGILGFILMYHFNVLNTHFFNPSIIIFFTFSCVVMFGLLLNFNLVEHAFNATPFLSWMVPYLHIISKYSFNDFSLVFIFSLCRYLVFTIQYLLLLYLFDVDIYNVLVLAGIWLVFFTKSIFPAFNFLNDLGVREAAALFFLGGIGIEKSHVIMASLSLWMVNIFFPMLVGLVIVLLAKYRDNISLRDNVC